MRSRWNGIAAGLLFVLIASSAARAQGAAPGIAPAVLAKANGGDAASQFLVGLEYQKGDVVPRDFVQAMAWYRKAADQGNAQAQCSLGMLLEQPNSGVIEDDAQAAAWLRKAADQGLAEAQYQLGQSLSRGKGVQQDDAQAAAWYQKAAAQKGADAMVALALLYAGGKGVAKDEKQASALMSQAADLGSAEAQYQLGLEYEQGHGVKKDKKAAMAWYRKSADQGNAGAQFNLGQLLESNHAEAYFWMSLAMRRLDGQELEAATALRDAAAEKLKPAEKSDADQRLQQWRPAQQPQP